MEVQEDMMTFEANCSNIMATRVYNAIEHYGVQSGSRNGPVLRFPFPIMMKYRQPWMRANFTPGRDANPFFHIAEAMWMLAGRRDVDFLTYFNKGMSQYSDNGETFNAAYGWRARREFGFDQLKAIPEILENSVQSRQAIVQLWHPDDLRKDTKDKACNMSMVFSVHGLQLDLTVFNRSNDLVFGGVTGANPVHFSYFQQWVANTLGIQMGELTFVSNNAHVYTDMPHWERMEFDPPEHIPRPLELPLDSLEEIEELCDNVPAVLEPNDYRSLHLREIVVPILNTWICRKNGDDYNYWLNKIQCPALFGACFNWLNRRDANGH